MTNIYNRILKERYNVQDIISQKYRSIGDLDESKIEYKRARGNKNIQGRRILTLREFRAFLIEGFFSILH